MHFTIDQTGVLFWVTRYFQNNHTYHSCLLLILTLRTQVSTGVFSCEANITDSNVEEAVDDLNVVDLSDDENHIDIEM